MARDKALQVNIDGSDPTNFPNKRIRNNSGSGDGTPVNEILYGDIHEFFAQLMRLYGILYTGLPDNTLNKYQLVEAVKSLASKNDFVLSITEDSGFLKVPLKLGFATEGEAFVCKSAVDKTTETQLQGTLDLTPVSKLIAFEGGDFKTGDYVRLVITAAGVDLIRLADGDTFDGIAADFNYLKAASQIEEDAGAINTVATTPLTNFTAFVERVNGASSTPFLATAIINGLMSSADKVLLDNLITKERNYGTMGPTDVDFNSPIGTPAVVSGDITQALVTLNTSEGEEWTITMGNAMDNTNYEVRMSIESTGVMDNDNDVRIMIFQTLSVTQFKIFLEEDHDSTQAIKIHFTVIQR